MSFKKLGVAVGLMMVLGTAYASIALGAASQPATARWYVGGTGLNAGETREVGCAVATHANGKTELLLEGEVGTTPVVIKASGVECLNNSGTAGSKSSIVQNGTSTAAEAEGRLNFTGVEFVTPKTCKVTENGSLTNVVTSIKTEELKAVLYEEGSTVFERFAPKSGSTFAAFGIGGTCAITTKSIAVTGNVFGKSPNATGVEKTAQPLEFSKTINTNAGGALFLGAKEAAVTGTANNTLVSGTAFGAKSK